MKKIFLEENNSKTDSNVQNFINVDIGVNEKLLPIENINEKVSAYEEYVSEKDASDNYRLIFTINPICTNILFNAHTEIVKDEGSSSCTIIPENGIEINSSYINYKYGTPIQKIKRRDAIRDTSFSHSMCGGYVYHCGVDIFNNHTLRRKEFAVINKLNPSLGLIEKAEFNMLSDYLRDSNGNIVKQRILKTTNNQEYLSNSKTNLHLYTRDSVKSYQDTVYNNLIENKGWVGFINPSSLNINNYGSYGNWNYCINKCMNNNKSGEQIDMYPDRSLYSFEPKLNKFRKRFEKNWDYCLTYPFENEENHVLVKNGIKCYFIKENDLKNTCLDLDYETKNTIENKIVYLKTQLRNTFLPGNTVNITVIDTYTKKEYTTLSPISIDKIGYMGEDTNHIFAINLMNLFPVFSMHGKNFLDEEGNLKSKYEMRVRKYVKGADCLYYIRKFRRLPNFKNSDICLKDGITEEDIRKYSGTTFNDNLNKLAFSENIYSDKMSQIVFNDDIITTGIKDNLGRDLSEIYLTIVKCNKGYKEWYKDKNYTGDTIEFSHCFGELTSGFDLTADEDNYNVHKIHNITQFIKKSPECLEKNITIEGSNKDGVFYGDIVEFSIPDLEENVIEKVYHRFNTAQREIYNSDFGSAIMYDEIVADDFDISDNGSSVFRIVTTGLYSNTNIYLNPEGYYYQSHYKIKLKEYVKDVQQGAHRRVVFNDITLKNNVYSGSTITNYYFNVGEVFEIYNKLTLDKINGTILSVDNKLFTNITFKLEKSISATDLLENYSFFKKNIEKPNNAYELNDGTGRYLWRNVKSDKDMVKGDELYDSFFTNGAHYLYQNINFYLKRQDPNNEYGLNNLCALDKFTGASEGKIKDITSAEYVEEGGNNVC